MLADRQELAENTYETYASRETRSCGNNLCKLREPADKNLRHVLTKVIGANRQEEREGYGAEHFYFN